MRIKFHPATIVEIYPNGQIEVFFADPVWFMDRFKIKMIYRTIQNSKPQLRQHPPGEYRFYMTGYRWNTEKSQFKLMPNV